MGEGKVNNITKAESLSWLKDNRNRFTPDYNAKRLFEITVLGYQYDEDYGRGMSSLCRAYSITEYGSSSNRICSVYKKYRKNYTDEEIQNAIYTIVRTYPNGIQNEEYPFFERKLEELLEGQRNYAHKSQAYDSDTIHSADSLGNAFGFGSEGGQSNTPSLDKDQVLVILIIAAIIIAIIFHKQLFNFISALIPYVFGAVIIYLIFKILSKSKPDGKSSSRKSASTFSKPKKNSNRTAVYEPRLQTSGKKVVGGIAWAAMFLYAAAYYKNAGDPTHWTIIAAAIGIVGGLSIMYK